VYDSISKKEIKAIEITVNNCAELDSVLTELNYTIKSIFIDSIVPCVFINNTPTDLKEQKVKLRKSIFKRMLLSNVLKSNQNILKERHKLIHLINKGDTKNKFVLELAQKYSGDTANLDELLQRVDIIPPSLAIAQAITESGWGTSRYAKEGNALFGHHVSKNDTGKYIKSKYSKVRLKAFNTILQSVEAYMHNINSTRTYRLLRLERRNIRLQGDKITGKKLTPYLTRYSIKGIEYVNALNNMIRVQKLARFDFVKLDTYDKEIIVSVNK
jgi:Bax protein